jgi:hypothetical protein
VNAAPINGFHSQWALDESDPHRHFAANVLQTLREDYQLRTDEAQLAFGRYLRRQTRWVTPDEAAYDAYRCWTPTVDPTVVLAREAEQRAHARLGDRTDLDSNDPASFDPAPVGEDTDRPRQDAVEADIAAAESALAMIRGQGRRHGFTGDHAQLVGQLRQVLDESAVWDTITPDDQPEPADLEPALRPDTVRERDEDDDMIVIDALFAGVTVTVMHQPGGIGPTNTLFFCDGPTGRGTLEVADTTRIGMIAAGDRTPNPERSAEYDNLGKQVRNHLTGLAEAVDHSREAIREQQTRRVQAAVTVPGAGIETGRPGTRAPRGVGR